MKHCARIHNISLRVRGGCRYKPSLRDQAVSAAAPAILRLALRDIRGSHRLERFEAATAYPTLRPAAGELHLVVRRGCRGGTSSPQGERLPSHDRARWAASAASGGVVG